MQLSPEARREIEDCLQRIGSRLVTDTPQERQEKLARGEKKILQALQARVGGGTATAEDARAVIAELRQPRQGEPARTPAARAAVTPATQPPARQAPMQQAPAQPVPAQVAVSASDDTLPGVVMNRPAAAPTAVAAPPFAPVAQAPAASSPPPVPGAPLPPPLPYHPQAAALQLGQPHDYAVPDQQIITMGVTSSSPQLKTGAYTCTITARGLELTHKKFPGTYIPVGTPCTYGGLAKIEVGGPISFSMRIRSVRHFSAPLAKAFVAFISGQAPKPPLVAMYLMPWYLTALVLLPWGIPILTIGGVVPVMIAGGIMAACGAVLMWERAKPWLMALICGLINFVAYAIIIGMILQANPGIYRHLRSAPPPPADVRYSPQPSHNDPPEPAGQPIRSVDEAIAALGDNAKRQSGLLFLNSARITEEEAPRVRRALAPLVDSDNPIACDVYCRIADGTCIPGLVRIGRDSASGMCWEQALTTLLRLDKSASRPVIEARTANADSRSRVVRLLQRDSVNYVFAASLLDSPNDSTVEAALAVLGSIGTQASIDKIKTAVDALPADRRSRVQPLADKAIASITARTPVPPIASVDEAVAKLADANRKDEAMRFLDKAQFAPADAAKVRTAMAPLMLAEDLRACTIYMRVADASSVADLTKLAKEGKDGRCWGPAFLTLLGLDEQAARGVIDARVATAGGRIELTSRLRSDAKNEKLALSLLSSAEPRVRDMAMSVLDAIGTPESIPAIEKWVEQLPDKDRRSVQPRITRLIAAIKARAAAKP